MSRDIERRVDDLEDRVAYADLSAGDLYLLMMKSNSPNVEEEYPGVGEAYLRKLREEIEREELLDDLREGV